MKKGHIEHNRKGEKHTTKQGYIIEIIEYFGWKNCTIQFNDERKTILKNKSYDSIVKRGIINPYHKTHFNIGFYGYGEYKAKINGKHTKSYKCWRGILQRCYDNSIRHKFPTYKEVVVCEEWHNFQNFAKWFEQNYIEGFVLDKDILYKGNKIYSPNTCCFVPQKINCLLIKNDINRGEYPIGVVKDGSKYLAQHKNGRIGLFLTIGEAFQAYKIAKEQHIKNVIRPYKDIITEQVYQTLYNYQVEITD